MLSGDVGEVRVGEPEPSGGQGDDDDAGRDERVPLGSVLGTLAGRPSPGRSSGGWWWCGSGERGRVVKRGAPGVVAWCVFAVLAVASAGQGRYGSGSGVPSRRVPPASSARSQQGSGGSPGLSPARSGRVPSRDGDRASAVPAGRAVTCARYGRDAWDGARRIRTASWAATPVVVIALPSWPRLPSCPQAV